MLYRTMMRTRWGFLIYQLMFIWREASERARSISVIILKLLLVEVFNNINLVYSTMLVRLGIQQFSHEIIKHPLVYLLWDFSSTSNETMLKSWWLFFNTCLLGILILVRSADHRVFCILTLAACSKQQWKRERWYSFSHWAWSVCQPAEEEKRG